MIYAAEITDNVVHRVLVVESMEFAQSLGGTWLQTYKDGTRKHFAGIGFTYDARLDAFIPPSPYPSWLLDEATCTWEAPVPMPPGGPWVWDEDYEEWVEA